MEILCPMCKTPMRSVSALTHGCVPCQRLYLMANGKLTDGGDWPVVEGKDAAIWATIIALTVFIVSTIALIIYGVVTLG